MTFIALVFAVMIGGIIYMSANNDELAEQVKLTESEFVTSEANLSLVTDEIQDLDKIFEVFNDSLTGALSSIYTTADTTESYTDYLNQQSLNDISELKRIITILSTADESLTDISELMQIESELLQDLPTHWPVSDRTPSVTMEFGPNIHPLTRQWYLHKGIDMGGPIGLPILAAARGTVIESSYDEISGYGNYVVIEHKYGFTTRYYHMTTRYASVGDFVEQGQQIGALGGTGKVSGPHLHFEVRLGPEVLDPASFLKISNNFVRWTGNRE